MQPSCQVADVLHSLGNKVDILGFNTWQLRTLSAIRRCRTAAMGGHIDACDSCGVIRISYNSCRNRHCPKCQGHKREAWIQTRKDELLPVPYFHVVFTSPNELNGLALYAPKQVYDILFKAAWDTLATFGKNKGVQMGMVCVLHTWGQNLILHPHLHCIVPGGGIDKSGKWMNIRADGRFLFPVKAMSKVFRAKYVAALRKTDLYTKELSTALFAKPWVVYAKRSFAHADSVVEYLGRYTHKIAISNRRITAIENGDITFTYKDYRTGGQVKEMTLKQEEFIRRFAQHILPKRFVRIRHYGILSSTWKRSKLKVLQQKMRPVATKPKDKQTHQGRCPCCREGRLITLLYFDRRGPPPDYVYLLAQSTSRKTITA